MTTVRSLTDWDRDRMGRLAWALFAAGLALVGFGGYIHVTMGDRTLGNCVETGVCDPWDTQWVLLPLVVGGVALLAALVVARR